MRRPNQVHLCGWPGCRRPVPLGMWGCRAHWFTLPDAIRDDVLRGWRFGRGRLSPEWIAANDRALEWIKGIPERAKDSRTDTPVPGTGGSNADSDPSGG